MTDGESTGEDGERDVVVRVAVRNTGTRPGREVVQIYLGTGPDGDYDNGGPRLAGFAAVRAEPGEDVVAEVHLAARVFQRWSPAEGRWRGRPAPYTLYAGPSADALPLAAPLAF